MKLSEISSKDVINDEDGVKLGKIVDAEIDVATGKIVVVLQYNIAEQWIERKVFFTYYR